MTVDSLGMTVVIDKGRDGNQLDPIAETVLAVNPDEDTQRDVVAALAPATRAA